LSYGFLFVIREYALVR